MVAGKNGQKRGRNSAIINNAITLRPTLNWRHSKAIFRSIKASLKMNFGRGQSRGHGGWRGSRSGNGVRGRGAGRGGTYPRDPPPATLELPYGAVIDRINIQSVLVEVESPKIEHAQYVASYNWLDGKDPVILVPGECSDEECSRCLSTDPD
jgi:hypothetical protein